MSRREQRTTPEPDTLLLEDPAPAVVPGADLPEGGVPPGADAAPSPHPPLVGS